MLGNTKQRLNNLYSFLCTNCIGMQRFMKAKDIINALPQNKYDHVGQIKRDIRLIRMSDEFSRKIGSSSRLGYGMTIESEIKRSHGYSKQLIRSMITTVLKDGIMTKKELYAHINDSVEYRINNGQYAAQTKMENKMCSIEEVRTYSDDLKDLDNLFEPTKNTFVKGYGLS